MEKQQALKFIVMFSIMLGLLVGQSTADGTWDCYKNCYLRCITSAFGRIPTACTNMCVKECVVGGTSLESVKGLEYFCKLGCVTSKCTELGTKEKPGEKKGESCLDSCSMTCTKI